MEPQTPEQTLQPLTRDSEKEDSLEVPQTERFDSWSAFMLLFAVSFGPAFIAVDLVTENTVSQTLTLILIVILVLVFLSNIASIQMLT